MYDHIGRGWFAIKLTAMGCMFVGFILALFMLGEQPLGLRLFQSKRTPEKETSEEQAPKEKYHVGTGDCYRVDLASLPAPEFGQCLELRRDVPDSFLVQFPDCSIVYD
jgi:hypothetical protein